MITVTKTKKWEIPRVFWLYRGAFPRCECKRFSRITSMVKLGRSDLWTIRKGGAFAGFAATVNGPKLVLLDYLAIPQKCRGAGVGTAALQELMEHYPALFVEIESTFVDAQNLKERQRRKQFYVNCGMVPMGTEADLFGVRMELLGHRCHLSLEQYRSFYRDHYSPWAAEHVKEVQP